MTIDQHDVIAHAADRLRAEIERERDDISHLLQQLSELGWEAAQRPDLLRLTAQQTSKAGRPSKLTTLADELRRLQGFASWLHATLIELRGERIFTSSSGADRLADLGIVSAPSEPVTRGKGRPSGRKKDELFLWWACVALMFARRKGNTVTVARAKTLAAEKVWPNLSKPATDLSASIKRMKTAQSPVFDLWQSLQSSTERRE